MQILIGILSLALVFAHSCQSKARIPQSDKIILDAIVEKIGKDPGVGSGFHVVYQFAKYKVTSVCEGHYDQPEIVVDHLLLDGNELKGLQMGDKVRLSIRRSNTIFVRNNEDGFREATDRLEYFYIGEKPNILPANCKGCESCS